MFCGCLKSVKSLLNYIENFITAGIKIVMLLFCIYLHFILNGLQLIIKFLKPPYHGSITYECIGGDNQWDGGAWGYKEDIIDSIEEKIRVKKLRKLGRPYSANFLFRSVRFFITAWKIIMLNEAVFIKKSKRVSIATDP